MFFTQHCGRKVINYSKTDANKTASLVYENQMGTSLILL